MTKKLIDKYNVPVPRYTSYPPANFFHPNFTEKEYFDAIEESNHSLPQHISFYIHIPFCRHLCHYCGCNSFPMMKQEERDRYIKALFLEIKRIKPLLNKERKIAQIHYGGGTPTLLPVDLLKEINELLLDGFELIESPEIAIECHPGYLDERYWEELTQAHFNRFSLGIQDFNNEVLQAVNRRPSLLPVEEIIEILRSANARINMDFIYGLPLQTTAGFSETIDKAIALRPDRLVTFSYAHVPWVSKRQLLLERVGLPSDQTKKELFEEASKRLLAANYNAIGMDHFVQEEDELYLALQENQLHRNFQGYCTKRTTGQVYAFGVTGISQLSSAYIQNTKSVEEYVDRVENGQFPIARGYQLSSEQQITKAVIDALMCNYTLEWEKLASQLQITKEEVVQALRFNKKELGDFVKDEIIQLTDSRLSITPRGKLFVRNVAASLDKLMINTTKKFSKPV